MGGADALESLALLVMRHARAQPDKLALYVPTRFDEAQVLAHEEVTYGQLWARVEAYRRGLRAAGYRAKDRFVLMFPVSVELYALVLALFSEGMVAVLVDTGMGVGKMLQAIQDARAVALISVEAVLRKRAMLPQLYGLDCYSVDGPLPLWRVRDLAALRLDGPDVAPRALAAVSPQSHALITFTSGSTGRPKGADRTHGHLKAQHLALSEHFPERVLDVDCPSFPVVVLHNLCCGMISVLPPVDLRAPAELSPQVVLAVLEARGVTRLAAAPAFMARLVAFMLEHKRALPLIRLIFVGGGPVSTALCAQIVEAFPQAESVVVYGSTEAEPMTSITMRERLQSALEDHDQEGTLVGYAAHCATLKLVNLPAALKLHRLDQRGLRPYEVEPGQVGEVVVSGPHVNKSYVDNPKANASNKLVELDGRVWHRTGDMGCFDARGRLWLVGRDKDVVWLDGAALHPFGVEEACEAVEGVARAALISHPLNPQRAALCWSPDPQCSPRHAARTQAALEAQLVSLKARHPQLSGLGLHKLVLMPVDKRHNTKIDRQALRAWLSVKPWPDARLS